MDQKSPEHRANESAPVSHPSDAGATTTPSQPAHKRRSNGHSQPPPLRAPADLAPGASPDRRHSRAAHKRRHPSVERATSFTAYPLGLALFAAWLVTLFATFSIDVVVDVFQPYLTLRDPPMVPWLLLVCTSAGLHLSLVCVVMLLGRLTKRRFRSFQPFVGGDAFVVLQLVGYGAVVTTSVVRAVLLSQRQERYGVYAVLGAFAVLGHVLLLYSLSFFQPPPLLASAASVVAAGSAATAAADAAGRSLRTKPVEGVAVRPGWRQRLQSTPQREIAWIVLCGALAILSSTVAEYHPLYRVVNAVVIVCFVASSLMTIQHAIVPAWLTDVHYHVLLPVVLKSPTMYVLQIFGNGLLLVTVYAELVLFNAQQDAPPSWHLSCGLMAVMAVGAHLLLVHQLHAWVVEEAERAEERVERRKLRRAESALLSHTRESSELAGMEASAPPRRASSSLGLDRQASQQESTQTGTPAATLPARARRTAAMHAAYKSQAGTYGPVLPSLVSVVLCVILIGILYVLTTSGDRLSAYARQGLSQTEALMVALLFLQPLITHPMGVFLYGKAYRIWQPFEGNPDFILLQCVGWFCYGLAIFFATLHLNERGHFNFLLLLMAFLVLSQFFIHMSVVRFGRNGAPGPQVDAPTSERAASRSPARSDAMSDDGSGRGSVSPQPCPSTTSYPGEGVARLGEDNAQQQLPTSGVFNSATEASFGSVTEPSFGSAGGATPFTSGTFGITDPLASSSALLSSVVNGELLLSIVLIGVSLVLRVVVIAAAYAHHFIAEKQARNGDEQGRSGAAAAAVVVQVPVTAIIAAATLFSVTATPTVQWSMRQHVRLLRPLSHAYVALATLGWGTYLLLLSRFVVLWGLLGIERVSTTSPITRVGLSCFLPSGDVSTWLRQACHAATVDAEGRYAAGEDTLSLTAAFEGAVEGFVWCFPFLCLLAGSLLETHASLRERQLRERVRRATESVLQLFHDHAGLAALSASSGANFPSHSARGTAEARLAHLLRTVAGPSAESLPTPSPTSSAGAAAGGGGNDALAFNSDAGSGPSADPADLKAVHDAARYMTFTLCAATSAAFLSAAFLADAQPIMTLGFSAVGTVSLGLSCVALHCIYGARVHSGTRPVDGSALARRVPVYALFMPFRGGTTFVVLQAVGWISYTCVTSLMIACVLEGKGTSSIFLLMAALSIVAQLALLRSVAYFDESKVLVQGFLQRNAEGFLAALSVVATVSFCRVYDMAEQGRATAHVVSSLLPIVACSIAVFLAIPLGLVSLQRQAELYGLGSVSAWFVEDEDEEDEDDDDSDVDDGTDDADEREDELAAGEDGNTTGQEATSREHSRYSSGRGLGTGDSTMASPTAGPHSLYSRANTETAFSPLVGTPGLVRRKAWASSASATARRGTGRRRGLAAVMFYLFSMMLAMLVIVVLPFALIFMGYAYCTQRATVTYSVAVRAVETLLCCFTALVVLPMIVVPVLGRSSVLRNVHSAFCCWALYNIPTYTFLGGISTPFFYSCRGTYLFTINMCSMALLSNLPYMPIAMSIFSMCSFAYFLRYHFYDGLYLHKHAMEPVQCVVDVAIAVFWLWYQRRYRGRPEITGRLQSRRATKFFQRNFFRGLCYYFSMRVVVADGHVLPQEEPYLPEASKLPRVDLSKPENQYMFSFHPHGVFPGTSIVVPKTELWEKAVGRCEEHFVSTHCADIVFNVPLMREFPLCLGAMSVSRRGIESSLRQGNSPLIVTGGQSEMLLTRMSDHEMHVVCNHTGFVRMAIKNRVPLVPVISFSESNILDNVHCIRLQRWFLKTIAFPFPVLPLGRCYLPLPTTKPVTMVIGHPIAPLPGRDNAEDPAHVEELRLRYFEHLEVLFYRYRAEAGYPEMELYVHNGIYHAGVQGTAAAVATRGSEGAAAAPWESAVRRALASTGSSERAGH